MGPEHKKLDCGFTSGSKDLQLTLEPVTFERVNLPLRNVAIRTTAKEKNRIDRLNQFAQRIGSGLSHALVLTLDLMENDPPKSAPLDKHFEELKGKQEAFLKLFTL